MRGRKPVVFATCQCPKCKMWSSHATSKGVETRTKCLRCNKGFVINSVNFELVGSSQSASEVTAMRNARLKK